MCQNLVRWVVVFFFCLFFFRFDFLPTENPFVSIFQLCCLEVLVTKLDDRWKMTELQMFAAPGDKYLVFDGKMLHKSAFSSKAKQNHAGAALLAGVVGDKLPAAESTYIIQRMEKVKKAFQGRVSHAIKSAWLETAKRTGMKMEGTSILVRTWDDVLQKLESNCQMESFVAWYNMCYKDSDSVGANKRKEGEAALMQELKIKYQDNTLSGGCLGDLFLAESSNLIETIVNRSRTKQNLHIVKSRPVKGEEEQDSGKVQARGKRVAGDFYVVRSDQRNGKAICFKRFNVSVSVATFNVRVM